MTRLHVITRTYAITVEEKSIMGKGIAGNNILSNNIMGKDIIGNNILSNNIIGKA